MQIIKSLINDIFMIILESLLYFYRILQISLEILLNPKISKNLSFHKKYRHFQYLQQKLHKSGMNPICFLVLTIKPKLPHQMKTQTTQTKVANKKKQIKAKQFVTKFADLFKLFKVYKNASRFPVFFSAPSSMNFTLYLLTKKSNNRQQTSVKERF